MASDGIGARGGVLYLFVPFELYTEGRGEVNWRGGAEADPPSPRPLKANEVGGGGWRLGRKEAQGRRKPEVRGTKETLCSFGIFRLGLPHPRQQRLLLFRI